MANEIFLSVDRNNRSVAPEPWRHDERDESGDAGGAGRGPRGRRRCCGSAAVPARAPARCWWRCPAAPVVPLDKLCASGTSYFGAPAVPYVPGVQGVGVVVEGTAGLPAGTPVWFATTAGMAPGDGSMRAHAVVAERDVVALPPGADPVLVAALGLSAVAAWMALTFRGGLAAGERVLVLGAGGVVGQAAVQLARSAGAGRVVAAARSARARERALAWARTSSSRWTRDDRDRAGGASGRGRAGRPRRRPAVRRARRRGVARAAARTDGWSTWAAPPPRRPRSTRRCCAAGSLRVLGYTNNELTPAQRAAALGHVVDEVPGRPAHRRAPADAARRRHRGVDRAGRPRRPPPRGREVLTCRSPSSRRRWSAATPSPTG